MADGRRNLVATFWAAGGGALRAWWHLMRTRGPNQMQFWVIALGIGFAAGGATLLFRKAIAFLQRLAYGVEDVHRVHTFAGELPWYLILCIPILGGLIVGLILHFFTPDGRARSVADVIEGAAVNNGRVEGKAGVASALASLLTLGLGGSSGREGPAVHMAAVMSSWVLTRLRADGLTGRDLLGCAVAAAVSASFNAPISGALFAMEVVLRHFAIHAFAPITIASVAGAVLARWEFGDVTEFVLPTASLLQFYEELPAFLLLGAVCGVVAGALMRSVFLADKVAARVQARTGMPRWLRPTVAGALLGVIAIFFPHVIGVGYETTVRALSGDLDLKAAILFAVVKAVAVAITLGGRMGGGIFSPSMMMGALTGLAFGLIATSVFPEISGSPTLYALAGLGGVAAAVLGAPISTTLIVFELTGDWAVALNVMVTVSISTAIGSKLVDRSFFLTQLEKRGVHLARGPQEYLMDMIPLRAVMQLPEEACFPAMAGLEALREEGRVIDVNARLEAVFAAFEAEGTREDGGATVLPVITGAAQEAKIVGSVRYVDALRAYSQALAATAAEEHS
ncbi:chloride channel protein [Pseudooceanicola sp. CBS1P-1]|uniref:Chloride channel protein n=1 Tax=Pseudooceanicola albus TaxID=2692189 RepID=A0A6L7FZC9_9RHOB|nr:MULTISPECIES: chloride channel protein [Pseudooceanicola]MBT9382574.1 chloride channel protein [Pseudooceanicola endophyticus]MXN17115.1 chloride channel protein [Pseudooceanicola albus]